MGSNYERRPYRQADEAYVPQGYDDYSSRRQGYEREAPYDSLYKRSFEPVPEDSDSRPSSSHRRSRRHHDRYDDDAAYYREQKQVSRSSGDYRDSYNDRDQYSRGGYGQQDRGYSQQGRGSTDYGERSYKNHDGEEGEEKKRLSGLCGKEAKDIAATVVGALGGAFLGHEASHGRAFGTLGGAVLGGLGANAVEHHHLKSEERRSESKRDNEY